MTAASGKPIDRILPTFVNQAGSPLVDVSLACAGDRTQITVTQTRFFVNPLLLSQGSLERWQVPLCVKAAGGAGVYCDVLEQPRQMLALDGGTCSPWVFANAGAQGYYRTAYSPEALRALALRVQDVLTATERLSLSSDEWALMRAGRHGVGEFLTLATGFANEQTNGVLSSVVDRLDFIHQYLTTDSNRPGFEAFVRSLFDPLFQQIGFASTAVDSDERRALRSTLIATLGTTGADQTLAAQARAAVDRALSGGAPLEPTLAGAIIQVAAGRGDRALHEALLAASDRATAPDEHYRYLYALAYFRDPALIDRGLEYSLSPKLRSQDAASFFSRFLVQDAARPRAWAFLKQHWTELEPKVTIFGGDTSLTGALATFCDSASRDDITSFFAAHSLPSAARTLGQTVERINNCVGVREKQAPALTEWLRNR